MSVVIALGSLFTSIALLLVPGGILFAPFVLGISALAFVAVLGSVGDRTVREHTPTLNPRGWREGS
jgi:hypothetical protein